MPACLLDMNVWLAAAFAAHPDHSAARPVLHVASAHEPALWCRATQQSFLWLASTPVITAAYGVAKATNADAWVAMEAFLALPQVDVMDEPPRAGSPLASARRDRAERPEALDGCLPGDVCDGRGSVVSEPRSLFQPL